MTYPHAFSHIGLSVTDLDQAVAFYTEVLGCYLLMKPTVIEEDDSAIGRMCTWCCLPPCPWSWFRRPDFTCRPCRR